MKRLAITFFWLLMFLFMHATNYYVDGGVAVSGNGLSWQSAWKTIAEANNHDLQPGDIVWVKDGSYAEGLNPSKSGAEIIPLSTGVVISQNWVCFPESVDLSAVDLAAHPGEYYLYVFRSWKSNNGVYRISQVNSGTRCVKVEGYSFMSESGIEGDSAYLSASIGRPVIFRNGATDPQNQRVVLDVSSTNIWSVGYISPGLKYIIIDGIDMTGSKNGGGWHLQSCSFNAVINSRIYNMGTVSNSGAPGVFINGNLTQGHASYNLIINNEIFNTPHEGVYIGSGGQPNPQAANQTHYNHIIGNRIYTSGSNPNAKLENAIDIKEYNKGNVAERNLIGPYQLSTPWNGAIDIVHHASHTLVYNNTFMNVSKGNGPSYYYIIGINNDATRNYVYNNLIYNDNQGTGYLYGISIKSTNLTNSYIAHNTIYNLPYGLLLDNSTGNSTTIANNIIHCNTSITNWSNNNLTLLHNLYLNAPGSYSTEPGRLIGNANFIDPINSDFRLTQASSLAVNTGTLLNPAVLLDFNLLPRDAYPDRGAFELPTHLQLPHTIVNLGDELCEGASGSLIVQQGLTIHSGSLTLIAAEKIILMPNINVNAGGHLHAYISNQLCENIIRHSPVHKHDNPNQPIDFTNMICQVYPNPVKDLLSLGCTYFTAESESLWLIYTSSGILVLKKHKKGSDSAIVDVSHLRPGIYFLHIKSADTSRMMRFVKI